MTVYTIDPLKDSRWSDLVTRHPHASAFHTTSWLEALRRTYGYQPIVFTTSPPQVALEDAVVACEVRSWLTGRRLVSLPFADHCEPLVESADAFNAISAHFDRIRRNGEWDYIELRPLTNHLHQLRGVTTSEQFWFHHLDLWPAEATLFAAFHKNAIQHQIHRADRERLALRRGLR